MQIILLIKCKEMKFTDKKRALAVYILFLCAFLFLSARIFIISQSGSKASKALAGQYTRRIDIASRDGFVFDRNGNMLGTVQDGFILFVNPAAVKSYDTERACRALSIASGKEREYFSERIAEGDPFTVESGRAFDAEYCVSFPKYKKDDGNFLCHLLGYKNSDGVGMSGVFSAYDEYLSDISGAAGRVSAVYQSDAAGRCIRGTVPIISDEHYTEKNGVYLTVDKEIQCEVEKICDGSLDMGAVVVMDIDSRELVSVVSRPAYDTGKVVEYLESDKGELINRAFQGYTPGSVFKTVIAAAELERDNSSDLLTYDCSGGIDVADSRIRCHKAEGHGELDMAAAFANSCNPYFINLGMSLGTEKIVQTAKLFGAGMFSSVNLIRCSKGTLPSNITDVPSDAANISVGQGQLLLTPVEVCSIVSTAVTGVWKKPSAVLKISQSGEEYFYGNTAPGKRVLEEETSEKLREMFEKCVSSGTGYRAQSEKVLTAGKTATAQSGQLKDGNEVIHRWFAGYFPADLPQYAVCVLCDGNGENNSNPADVFRAVAERIYGLHHE